MHHIVRFLFIALLSASAQDIPLWPVGYPEVDHGKPDHEERPGVINNIHNPRLIPFPQSNPNGTALIICPGGGYAVQATLHEGSMIAEYFTQKGITCFVLRYRLPGTAGVNHKHPAPASDALRAIQIIRSRAAEFKIDPDKIGIAGSSAGGHLAASAVTLFNQIPTGTDELSKVSARPDFACLAYPVITTKEPHDLGVCIAALCPQNKADPLYHQLSLETRVTKDCPPTFLHHPIDDQLVPYMNSVLFHNAMVKAGAESELFLCEKGKHGYGLGKPGTDSQEWTERFLSWLRKQGLLEG